MTTSQGNRAHDYDEAFEWGYSHAKSLNSRGELAPITHERHPDGWFSSREKAEEALLNDLRWRIPTFLIRRPRPAQPEIVGRPILTHVRQGL